MSPDILDLGDLPSEIWGKGDDEGGNDADERATSKRFYNK